MSRSSLTTLEHLDIPLARIELDRDLPECTLRNAIHHPEGVPYSVTLLNANADETPWALATLPRAAASGTWKIGYWYWELSHFPLVFADRFPLLDEIWAPSTFCRDAYRAISSIPVNLVPPYVPPPGAVEPDRARFGLRDDSFVFFFAFDAGSVPERKNPIQAIEALRRLQHSSDRPCALLLKVGRPDLAPELVAGLESAAAGLPVAIVSEGTSRGLVDSMLASSDAILSLHRSEGLGLLPIEGLYLEKPVVATHYGGVTDYLDASTGYPVRYSLTSLREDYPPYPKGSSWADPDLEHAVEQMSRVLRDPEQAREKAREGRRRVTTLYGLDAAACRTGRELERIFAVRCGAASSTMAPDERSSRSGDIPPNVRTLRSAESPQ